MFQGAFARRRMQDVADLLFKEAFAGRRTLSLLKLYRVEAADEEPSVDACNLAWYFLTYLYNSVVNFTFIESCCICCQCSLLSILCYHEVTSKYQRLQKHLKSGRARRMSKNHRPINRTVLCKKLITYEMTSDFRQSASVWASKYLSK